MQDFKCVIEDMESIQKDLDTIQSTLESTLEEAAAIYSEVESGDDWAGEAQLVGTAFMDLVVQFHRKLAEHEGGAVNQASEAFQNYIKNDEIFFTDWTAYQDVLLM